MIEQSITVDIKINAMRLPISRYDKVIGITSTLMLRKIIKVGSETNSTKIFKWPESNIDSWILGMRGKIPGGKTVIEVSHIFLAVLLTTFGIFMDSKYGAKGLRESSGPWTGRHTYTYTYIKSGIKAARTWGATILGCV